MWRGFAESGEGTTTEASMGYLKYLRNAKTDTKDRLIQWRKEPVTTRINRPTRLDRARALGYKPKQGVIVVRQRLKRGGHTRPHDRGGRRPSRSHFKLTLEKNYQQVAEERVSKKYVNCEVLGSYLVAKDGKHYWFEVVLVERRHPQILADKRYIGIAAQRGRAARGVTSAGRKARGLRKKGKGVEKHRPSLRANKGRH